MNPFKELTGVVSPLLDDDMNTDQIIPSAYLKDVHANLGEGLFAYLRRRPNGEIINSFVLEKESFNQVGAEVNNPALNEAIQRYVQADKSKELE